MGMARFSVFISYVSEDTSLASEIAGGLKANGITVWYDKFALKVGDQLLDSIEDGLKESKAGILLISTFYLQKGWTNYEMDTLIRKSIEQGSKLLLIWHGVSKEEVENRHPGLAAFRRGHRGDTEYRDWHQ